MSNLGYDAAWCTYPACWVGAVHRRERIFVIAYSNSERLQRRMLTEKQQKTNEQSERTYIHLLQGANTQYLSESAIFRKSDGISNRVDRSKALGNSVVPQQAYPVFKAIADIEMT